MNQAGSDAGLIDLSVNGPLPFRDGAFFFAPKIYRFRYCSGVYPMFFLKWVANTHLDDVLVGRGIEGGFEPPLELAQGEVPLYDLKGTLVGRYRYDGGVPDIASPVTGKNASLYAYRSVEGGNLEGTLPSAGIRP